MASYKKYAENLVGNWEKDIYEPQKQITQDIYRTNWNQLVNNYNDVRDKLTRNFELAKANYTNSLNDIQDDSFNRMSNVNADLASRGLSGSGVINRAIQGDTTVKGEASDRALANLLAQNNASIEGLGKNVIGLGQGQTQLASDLSGDLGTLTDKDAANNQALAGLLADVSEGAARRAASRSGSGKSKSDKNMEEQYRRLGIAQTLLDDTIDDDTKSLILGLNYDVTNAGDIVNAYNNNKTYANNYISTSTALNNARNNLNNSFSRPSYGIGAPLRVLENSYNLNRVNNLTKNLNDLTYSDLNELLYGKK